MHIDLFISRIVRRFQESVTEACNFMDNYIYYRKRSHSHRTAWSMARNTINHELLAKLFLKRSAMTFDARISASKWLCSPCLRQSFRFTAFSHP